MAAATLHADMALFLGVGCPANDDEPLPAMPAMPAVFDALARPCWCGAASVALVYKWRPDGQSLLVAMCRDHKDVGDPLKEGTP